MNEKLYKICEDIVDNEEEVKKFMQFDSMVEMYEYFHVKVPELSEEEFEDFIVDVLEGRKETKNTAGELSDDDLENVAGGFNMGAAGAKVAAVGFTLASLLPAVGATNQPSVNESTSANTSISQTIDKKEVKNSQKSQKVGNFITRTFAKCVNKMSLDTALIQAVDKKEVNEKWVRLLLENGADVNFTVWGNSALSKAVKRENKEIIKLLLEYGADINIKNYYNGRTALMNAVENRNQEIAKMLLEKSADVNIRNNNGWSALMLAVEKGDLDIVDMLLEHGAKVNSCNHNDKTALDIAEDQPQSKKMNIIINMLKEKGAKTYEELNTD